MYLGAVAIFSLSIRELIGSFIDIRQYSPFYESMNEYLSIENKMTLSGSDYLPLQMKEMEFSHVSFRYPGSDKDVLNNINIKISHNERIAIVGENGSGKTTLVKLLMRLYDPTEGQITLNGQNIKNFVYSDYTNQFTAVFQDFKLFAFSIKENVALSSEENTNEKVLDALKRSGFDVDALEDGINTTIYKLFDSKGIEPSGGEAQKIAFARALYKDAQFVILDEPTAAIDSRAEHDIFSRFDSMVKNKTSIYISHRLASTKFCDKILVMSKGSIVEMGTHQELMDQKSFYYELYHMQSGFFMDNE
jgi:ATP-binding cassette subfamily B protein/ATP-binding cassette subfamily C protein